MHFEEGEEVLIKARFIKRIDGATSLVSTSYKEGQQVAAIRDSKINKIVGRVDDEVENLKESLHKEIKIKNSVIKERDMFETANNELAKERDDIEFKFNLEVDCNEALKKEIDEVKALVKESIDNHLRKNKIVIHLLDYIDLLKGKQ